MSNKPLDFAAGKRRFRKREDRTARRESGHLTQLRIVIDAAQQASKSREMVYGGYVGAGLKREIESARQLPALLAEAGSIVQAMIGGCA